MKTFDFNLYYLVDFRQWIGRTESASDTITAAPIAGLAAMLDRDDPPPSAGDRLPLLWHWLYFLPRSRASELDADGHARRGGFLPPVPLARRMYAGGRVEVHHSLCVGDPVRRVSRVVDVRQKEGRGGPLVFVTVRHEISNPTGVALIEDHDIVYRGSGAAAAPTREDAGGPDAGRAADTRGAADRPPNRGATGDPEWTRDVVPDEVLLFRYSALTFNAYRIHYDRRFAEEQGYPGLVVHAPLVATLLADLVTRRLPEVEIATFVFRALRPLFDGMPMVLCGGRSLDGSSVDLWARGPDGAIAFEAAAHLRSG